MYNIQHPPGTNIENTICNTLLEMMESQPYYSVKVTELVKRAGISRSSFYIYFDSIYAVLQKIEDDFLALLPDDDETFDYALLKMNANIPKKMDRSTVRIMDAIADNARIYLLLTGPNGDGSFQIRLRNRYSRIQKKLLESEIPGLSPQKMQIISLFFAGGRLAVNDYWMHHPNCMDIQDMTRYLTDLYTTLFCKVISDEKG